jgi:tRNA threonylcarbamoyladenosine biosynthesis protein TsaB
MTIPRWEWPKNIQSSHAMKLLAFDTSTGDLSIAVSRTAHGHTQVWTHTGPGGAMASSTLIPAIMALLAEAGLSLRELDAIAFGAGPGSFTGLRTACAVAQGLGHGAGVPLLPVDTLLAVAEEARHGCAPDAAAFNVVAVLDARMDEVYTAVYAWRAGQWTQPGGWDVIKPEALAAADWAADAGLAQPSSAPPVSAVAVGAGGADAAPPVAPAWVVAGNAFAAYGERLLPGWPRVHALPTATALLRLAPALLAAGQAVPPQDALPRYIRDKVAKTSDERADEKAAALALHLPPA